MSPRHVVFSAPSSFAKQIPMEKKNLVQAEVLESVARLEEKLELALQKIKVQPLVTTSQGCCCSESILDRTRMDEPREKDLLAVGSSPSTNKVFSCSWRVGSPRKTSTTETSPFGPTNGLFCAVGGQEVKKRTQRR